ncbi:RnfABCDGE type electron transport complex subunit D [Pseudothermotoga sp.]|nr:RnfABCDGE type electron transport complex subunit D [Pseudothermotoga sp.]
MSEKFFLKQPMMRRMLYALAPIYAFAVFAYGFRVILLSLIVFPTGIFVEYLFERAKRKPVSEAVLVSCALFVLAMPPKVPLWIATLGIAFGIAFGKCVYGGFGRNVFNPAITGRLFIYITFPAFMTAGWISPSLFGIDAVSSATPLELLREGVQVKLSSLFLGWRAGSIGEAPIFLMILSALYLVFTRTASWRIIVSTFGSATILSFLLDLLNAPKALPVVPAVLSGSLLFVSIFMATDPVSSPRKVKAHWLFGTIVGVSGVLVRTFSLFPEGWSFAIMIANSFAPLLDELMQDKKKVKA